MKLVDHVRWHVCEGHERLFRRLPPFSLSLCRVPVFFPRQETENARPPRARGACVLADKRETLELYISILGLDKRDRRESLQPWTLGASRGIGAHGNSWEEDRGRTWMEREREGRRGDGFVVFLLFYRSFWAPLPEKGAKDLITKNDLFDDFGFESFVDRFLKAMPLRMYVWEYIHFGNTMIENLFYRWRNFFWKWILRIQRLFCALVSSN